MFFGFGDDGVVKLERFSAVVVHPLEGVITGVAVPEEALAITLLLLVLVKLGNGTI